MNNQEIIELQKHEGAQKLSDSWNDGDVKKIKDFLDKNPFLEEADIQEGLENIHDMYDLTRYWNRTADDSPLQKRIEERMRVQLKSYDIQFLFGLLKDGPYELSKSLNIKSCINELIKKIEKIEELIDLLVEEENNLYGPYDSQIRQLIYNRIDELLKFNFNMENLYALWQCVTDKRFVCSEYDLQIGQSIESRMVELVKRIRNIQDTPDWFFLYLEKPELLPSFLKKTFKNKVKEICKEMK